jgi:putative oxidoreductase
MKGKDILCEILVCALIVLFLYTPLTKLLSYKQFTDAMEAQPLAHWVQTLLIYTLPYAELLIAFLLIIFRTRLIGLYAAGVLLLIFTGYITLVELNVYHKIPCTCGGVIRRLTWGQHLVFNIFFILADLVAILLIRKGTWWKKVPAGTHSLS